MKQYYEIQSVMGVSTSLSSVPLLVDDYEKAVYAKMTENVWKHLLLSTVKHQGYLGELYQLLKESTTLDYEYGTVKWNQISGRIEEIFNSDGIYNELNHIYLETSSRSKSKIVMRMMKKRFIQYKDSLLEIIQEIINNELNKDYFQNFTDNASVMIALLKEWIALKCLILEKKQRKHKLIISERTKQTIIQVTNRAYNFRSRMAWNEHDVLKTMNSLLHDCFLDSKKRIVQQVTKMRKGNNVQEIACSVSNCYIILSHFWNRYYRLFHSHELSLWDMKYFDRTTSNGGHVSGINFRYGLLDFPKNENNNEYFLFTYLFGIVSKSVFNDPENNDDSLLSAINLARKEYKDVSLETLTIENAIELRKLHNRIIMRILQYFHRIINYMDKVHKGLPTTPVYRFWFLYVSSKDKWVQFVQDTYDDFFIQLFKNKTNQDQMLGLTTKKYDIPFEDMEENEEIDNYLKRVFTQTQKYDKLFINHALLKYKGGDIKDL